MRRRTIAAGFAATAVLTAACGGSDDTASTSGDDYPSSEITMIVPWGAGSGPDSTARTIASGMEDELGQRIVILNKDGGSGTIGLSELAAAEPDGYTISWMASAALNFQWQRIDTPFNGPEETTPIAQVISVVSIVYAAPDSGIDSVEALVEKAKEAPGEVTVGLPGEGSQMDIGIRLLEEEAGIDLDLQYFGAGEQILPVVNGTIDVGVAQAAPVVQYVERGDLQWVGVFGPIKPSGIDAPLISDAGYVEDDPMIDAYEGMVAPAGIPDEIVEKLAAAVETSMESTEFQDYITSVYGAPDYVGPEDLQAKVDEGVTAGTEIIEKFGL